MTANRLWEQHWQQHTLTGGELWTAAQRHRILTRLVGEMASDAGKKPIIVEAGCGIGYNAFLIADSCLTLGVDTSPAALRQHRRQYPASKASGVVADILHIPLPDASVDFVFNAGVMEHFTDAEKACILREFRRVLKPAGTFFVTVPGKYSFWHLYRIVLRNHDFGYEEYHTRRSFAAILERNGWEITEEGGIDPLTLGTFCRRFFGVTLPIRSLPGAFNTEIYFVAHPRQDANIGFSQPSSLGAAAVCPVCGHRETLLLKPLTDGYVWRVCPQCDLQFSSPMRAGSLEYYRNFYLYRRRSESQATARPLWHIGHTWEYASFLSLKLHTGGTLLDLGCGRGEFLALAKSAGYDVYGLDENPDSIAVARAGYGLANVACGNLQGSAELTGERQYDCITMFSVLEHLEDPLAAVKMAARLLRPQGYLTVYMPARHRWPALFCPGIDEPPHHLSFWSEESIRRLFQAAGLSTVLVQRKPLEPADILSYVHARVPGLKWSDGTRVALWNAGRSTLDAPLRWFNKLKRVRGFDLLGVAQK